MVSNLLKVSYDIEGVLGLSWAFGIPTFDIIHASEKKNFLLYYAVPLLMKYLPDMYVLHLMLLVGGIYGLLKETISLQERESSAYALSYFVYRLLLSMVHSL